MIQNILKNKKTLYALLGTYAATGMYSFIISSIKAYKLKKKAQRKLILRNSLKITLPEISQEKQSLILSLTATQLARAIKEKRVTSTEAVATYISRSITIGRELNLIAEECYIEALEKARICDEMTENNESFGVFHGVPISVKDQMAMEGYTSSTGVAWRLDHRDRETAMIVKMLQDEGAIPFVRSNGPQVMMWFECSNQIYGRGLNPWDPSRTTGGSSGGEGGLIACRGSPLGLGADIGGSIRYPSAFCGVYGFKPTPQRMPTHGMISSMPNKLIPMDFQIQNTAGPIGRCVKDLVLVMRC